MGKYDHAFSPITIKEVKARNFAFDITPAELISAIITEEGVVRPSFREGLRELAKGR